LNINVHMLQFHVWCFHIMLLSLIIILHSSVVFLLGWSFSALLQNTLSYWHQAAGTMAVWWAYIVTNKGSYTQTIFLFAFVVHIIFWAWTRWCTCDASTLGWISIWSGYIHFGWWVFVGWVAIFFVLSTLPFSLLCYLMNLWNLLLVKCQIRLVRMITINEFQEALLRRNLSWRKCHRSSVCFVVILINISYYAHKIFESVFVNVCKL